MTRNAVPKGDGEGGNRGGGTVVQRGLWIQFPIRIYYVKFINVKSWACKAPWQIVCCGIPTGVPNSGLLTKGSHWSHFANIQPSNLVILNFEIFPYSASLSNLYKFGLDNFLKQQKCCKLIFHGSTSVEVGWQKKAVLVQKDQHVAWPLECHIKHSAKVPNPFECELFNSLSMCTVNRGDFGHPKKQAYFIL